MIDFYSYVFKKKKGASFLDFSIANELKNIWEKERIL